MMWVGRNTRVGARGNKTSRHIVGWGEEEVDRAVECCSGCDSVILVEGKRPRGHE
jgi:hypothetical protein